jgi:hypothetical protein
VSGATPSAGEHPVTHPFSIENLNITQHPRGTARAKLQVCETAETNSFSSLISLGEVDPDLVTALRTRCERPHAQCASRGENLAVPSAMGVETVVTRGAERYRT